MMGNILNDNNVCLSMVTQSQIKFKSFDKDLNSFYNELNINDCDQPFCPVLKIDKITSDMVKISWKINKFDERQMEYKPIKHFEIQYASVSKKKFFVEPPKKSKKKKKKHKKKSKKKKKRKKRKRDISDTDDDSDESESSDDSESDSDTDSDSNSDSNSDSVSFDDSKIAVDDIKENKFDNYDWKTEKLKWILVDKIRYNPSKKRAKKRGLSTKILNLKPLHPYLIRIRCDNNSGWSEYCKPILIQTKKEDKLQFGICSPSYMNITDKGKTLKCNGDCNGHICWSKKGYNSGVYIWSIKRIYGLECFRSVGITNCKPDMVKSGLDMRIYSISYNTKIEKVYYYDGLNNLSKWNNNDIITIKLDCIKWKVSFYKMKYCIKQEKIMKNKKYYFVIETCTDPSTSYQIIKPQKIKK